MSLFDKDKDGKGWRKRWHMLVSPAPDVRAMVPYSYSKRPNGSVVWLILADNMLVYLVTVPGDSTRSGEDAILSWRKMMESDRAIVPSLHKHGPLYTLGSTKTILPLPPKETWSPPAEMTVSESMMAKYRGETLMSQFCEHLDKKAFDTAHKARVKANDKPSVNAYNTYLGANAGGDGDKDKVGLWRVQVAERWPALAIYLMPNPNMVKAVDSGSSVVDAAALCLQIRGATLRALPADALIRSSGSKNPGLHRALRFADTILADHLPRTTEEWSGCYNLAETLVPLLSENVRMRAIGRTLNIGWNPDTSICVPEVGCNLLSASIARGKPRWSLFAPENEEPNVNAGLKHFGDAARALFCEVYLPSVAVRIGENAAVKLMESARSSGTILMLANRSPRNAALLSYRHLEWTRLPLLTNVDGFAANPSYTDSSAYSGEWDAPLPPAVSPDEWRIIPLLTRRALQAEGVEMGHCVGGYDSVCRAGLSSIVGVHGPKGERSTAELRSAGPNRLTIYQHRGRKNSSPPRGAGEALNWYLNAASRGEIPFNSVRMALMSSLGNKRGNPNLYNGGANVHVGALNELRNSMRPEHRTNAWNRWRNWLESSHLSPEDWLVSVSGVTEELLRH